MEKTHELELVIGIDALGLISQGNIEGAKIALGVKEDSQVLQAFCEMLTENVRKSIERFSNTGIIHGSIKNVQEPTLAPAPDPTPAMPPSDFSENDGDEEDIRDEKEDISEDIPKSEYNEEQDSVPDVEEKEGALISSVFEQIFKIKSEGNRIFSLSVKNDYNFETLYRELMLEKGQIEYNPYIEDDYIIQYVDEKGDNVIVGGKVNNV